MQKNTLTGVKRSVKRIVEWRRGGLWRFWSDQDLLDEAAPRTVDVPSGSDEYNAVVAAFQQPTPGPAFTKPVTKVERVVNAPLLARYVSKAAGIASECPVAAAALRGPAGGGGGGAPAPSAIEAWLIHGTSDSAPTPVALSTVGIDYRYSRADWTQLWFGRAAYFAELTQYSHANYRHNPTSGEGQLILACVCKGVVDQRGGYTDDTKKLMRPNVGCHCVRGVVDSSTMTHAVMVYGDDQSYPAYIVTYRK